MGFSFGFFLAFIVIPASIVLLLAWSFSKKSTYRNFLASIWLVVFGLILLSNIIQWLNSKTILDKQDYYGEYVVKRDFFKGRQSDWQYNHFRFEITEQDSIFFHTTDLQKIIQTFRGTINTTASHQSARLILNMAQPTHHIILDNPTTYRSSWSFYLVFRSPKFHNVFFTKGKWKPIKATY